MMNPHEARLHAMLDLNSTATWNLNYEDRDAIQWLFDEAFRLKEALYAARQSEQEAWRALSVKNAEIERAIGELHEARSL